MVAANVVGVMFRSAVSRKLLAKILFVCQYVRSDVVLPSPQLSSAKCHSRILRVKYSAHLRRRIGQSTVMRFE